MGMLWMGGEDTSFVGGTLPLVSTTAGSFRVGYGRCSLNLQNRTMNCYSKVFSGGAITTAWLHCRIQHGNVTSTDRIIGITKGSTLKGIYFYISAASGNMGKASVGSYNGAAMTNLAAEAGHTLGASVLRAIDLLISSYGAAGTVTLYIDGAQVCTYTGDISIAGVADLDTVTIGVEGNWVSKMSEIIVADEDTRAKGVVTNYLNGAGTLDEWEGAYTDIDEDTISDLDLISTDTINETFRAALSNIPAGSFSVDAVKIEARAYADPAANPQTLKLGVRSGGSSDVDAGQAMAAAWTTYERLMSTINGNPITDDIVDAMEVEVQSAA